jgi:hypothetical protein
MPTTTASPEKTTNSSPFAFSMPNTGFGTVKLIFFLSFICHHYYLSSQHSVPLLSVIQQIQKNHQLV